MEVDWSCCGGTAEQCEGKLIAAIEALQEDDDAKPFSVPVDLKDYPEYSLNVDYPVDLETISKRAQNKYYRFLLPTFLLLDGLLFTIFFR